jgi:hypothetical protein
MKPGTRWRCVQLVVLALVARVASAAPAGADASATVDVSGIKEKLVVWSDGKQHFIAMVMTRDSDSPIFWSRDGRRFQQLRVYGGASEGYDDALKRLDRNFWEPRQRGGEASLRYSSDRGTLVVECAARETPLQKLGAAERTRVLEGATFHPQPWERRAYALARDDTGRYFYVDNLRQPEDAKAFRLFAGPRGALKLMKMANVVSDSQGDIFSTAQGQLRLILARQDSTWIVRKKITRLVWLPVDDNAVMIYTDLGVYAGERFGTPCDDL